MSSIYMTADDLASFDHPLPDHRIRYGDDPLQFGDLRLPPGDGPHPVAVFIHGGCWQAQYDIAHSDKLTAALARDGIATWSLEYRRVGNEGGGWPGTFLDVGQGADYLRQLAGEYDLDLAHVIAMGHSAGGQLALWLASRAAMPANCELFADAPLPIRGVLALAPAADLAWLHASQVCDGVVDGLMGGSPDELPARYELVDPMRFSPGATPQVLVIGRHDEDWRPVGERYFEHADQRGDTVSRIEAAESGHFEMIDPDSTTWPLVRDAARALAVGR